MLRRLALLFLFLAAPFAAPAAGTQIYRCASAGGVSFQETPCGAASAQSTWDLPAFPPANSAERERLLQREAALDARMLRRAELEAAERIAREARRARELELQAERERAAAAEAQTIHAVPLFFRPARSWRPRPPPPFRY